MSHGIHGIHGIHGTRGISWPDLGERRGARSAAAVGRRPGLRAEFAAGTAMPGRGGQGLRREKGLEHLETNIAMEN